MEQETNLKESEFHYDLNYSHFIRVKTAKDDDISIGISFRVNLEYEIAKIQTDDSNTCLLIISLTFCVTCPGYPSNLTTNKGRATTCTTLEMGMLKISKFGLL